MLISTLERTDRKAKVDEITSKSSWKWSLNQALVLTIAGFHVTPSFPETPEIDVDRGLDFPFLYG